MIYKELPIHPILAPYVNLIWTMESENHDESHITRVLPDGILEFVNHYGDPWITTFIDQSPEIQPQSFIVSQMRKAIDLKSNGFTGFISVRFYPWGGYQFFRYPSKNLIDTICSSKVIWPEYFKQLINSFGNALTTESKSQRIQEFLIQRLNEHRKNEPQLEHAIKLIRQSGGKSSITQICQASGCTTKQLERKFLALVGTTPKVFSRVCRFLTICNQMETYRDKSLSQLGYECGYFDQAHFIKDFREFSGFNPKQLHKMKDIGFAKI